MQSLKQRLAREGVLIAPGVFDLPLVANMVEGGRTPLLSQAELEALGYKLALFPGTGFLAAAAALRDCYGLLKQRGSTVGADLNLYAFEDFGRLMGFDEVYAFERRHAR